MSCKDLEQCILEVCVEPLGSLVPSLSALEKKKYHLCNWSFVQLVIHSVQIIILWLDICYCNAV